MADRKQMRYLRAIDDNLESKPDSVLVDYLRIPEKFVSPVRRIARRVIYATAALFAAVFLVYIDRGGYKDVREGGLTLSLIHI